MRTEIQDRFDGAALHAALDAERRRRGVSWSALAAEIRVSPSTLARTKRNGPMEADGVLGMTRWLGVPLESFSRTNRRFAENPAPPGSAGFFRLNTPALYAAVEERRQEEGRTRRELAESLGAAPAQLAHLAEGGRIGVHLLLTILEWLERSAASFLRATDR